METAPNEEDDRSKRVGFNFRGKKLWYEIDQLIYGDEFLLKNLIDDIECSKDEYNNLIVNEDHKYARCIINSMINRKLIIDKNLDPTGVAVLADKWCCPEWFIEEVNKLIKIDLFHENFKELILDTFVCKICKSGFKLIDNLTPQCKHHPGERSVSADTWTCCGQSYANRSSETRHCIVIKPCSVGYHVPDLHINEMNIRLNLYEKMKGIKN